MKKHEKACKKGDGDACFSRAGFTDDCNIWFGLASGEGADRQAPWYVKGCTLGHKDSCGMLSLVADWTAEGQAVPKDLAKAKEYHELACAKGTTESCEALKKLAAPAEASATSAARAATPEVEAAETAAASADPREQACLKGEALQCLVLGDENFEDVNSATQAANALPYYQKACDGGFGKGCFYAAYIYNQGLGAQKDTFRARPMFIKACDDDQAMGCAYVGQYLDFGLGGSVDKAGATKAYQKACAAGLQEVCDILAKR